MAGLLVLFVLVLPFVELAVLVAVAGRVGLLVTLAVIIGVGLAGGRLIQRQGLGVWRRAETRLRTGEVPTAEVANGLLILLAGLLLALPGFVSDLLAIALLAPPVRAVVRARLLRRFEQRVHSSFAGPVGVAFGGPRTRTRVSAGRATYDVSEVADRRPGLDRP